MAENKGHDNLIPVNQRTKDEQRRIQTAGGVASGKARREKADFKRKCQMWMESTVATDKDGNPMTGADLMVAVAARQLADGNSKFWELMRDTAGYKPVDKVVVAEVEQSTIDEVEGMVLNSSGTEPAANQEAENGQ